MNHKEKKSKGLILGAVVLLALAVAGLVIAGGAARKTASRPAYAGGYPVHISELMSSNTALPNGDGLLCDWVEIANTSHRDFDLSGYYLSDEEGKGKYTFPPGSVVPAGG